MSAFRRSRRHTNRYFLLRRADQPAQVARISARGASSRYDVEARTWVNEPLLGAQIRITGDWMPVSAADLPSELDIDPADLAGTGGRRHFGRRRPAPGVN